MRRDTVVNVVLKIHKFSNRDTRDKLEKVFGWTTLVYKDEMEVMIERVFAAQGTPHICMHLHPWVRENDTLTHEDEFVMESSNVYLSVMRIRKTISSDSDVTRYWIEDRRRWRYGGIYVLSGNDLFNFWVRRDIEHP